MKELERAKKELEREYNELKGYNPPGNGNAVFFSDGTEEEYDDFIRHHDRGWGKFYNKIKNLGK